MEAFVTLTAALPCIAPSCASCGKQHPPLTIATNPPPTPAYLDGQHALQSTTVPPALRAAAHSRLDAHSRTVLPQECGKLAPRHAAAPLALDAHRSGACVQEGTPAARHAPHALDEQRRPARAAIPGIYQQMAECNTNLEHMHNSNVRTA